MKLLRFSVENYRSFNSRQELAINFDDHCVNAIIGPNGCGKSNLFTALKSFIDTIHYSTKFNGQNSFEPFVLKKGNDQLPTSFSIEIEDNDTIYAYSFSIIKGVIISESLKRNILNTKFCPIFSRKSIPTGRYKEFGFNSDLLSTTRDDALILTRAYENNNPIAVEFFNALSHIKLMSGTQDINNTAQKINADASFKQKVLTLLKQADLSILDLSVSETKIPAELLENSPFAEEVKKSLANTKAYNISTTHLVRGEDNRPINAINLSMINHESEGTRRIFEMAYPLINTLENGHTLFIDEFDSSLHPAECELIIKLFEKNITGAQLIVNTHYAGILDAIGRKNIHLIGKNQYEESIIGKIPGEARDTALEKKYRLGFFGAVPNITETAG
ncbi:MAG: ATP/GTP-binding protein [Candidatus Nanosyncoccaceae bacterium]